jgi:hypothetical protein
LILLRLLLPSSHLLLFVAQEGSGFNKASATAGATAFLAIYALVSRLFFYLATNKNKNNNKN